MSLASLLDPDRRWMRLALMEAQRAAEAGEVPVGAVVVKGGQIVGRGHNQVERLADPTRSLLVWVRIVSYIGRLSC